MDYLNWELTVLARAIRYPNLTVAAGNIGISQPQLSRIVARLEEELEMTLLKRPSKKQSSWSAQAFKLSELYMSKETEFFRDIKQLGRRKVQRNIKFACLEGLVPTCNATVSGLLDEFTFHSLRINVYDIHELEELFLAGSVDAIFTVRLPDVKGDIRHKVIGYQQVETQRKPSKWSVFSTYEYDRLTPDTRGVLISNSLDVRRFWIEEKGFKGSLPSELLAKKPKSNAETVYVIAGTNFPEVLWEKL